MHASYAFFIIPSSDLLTSQMCFRKSFILITLSQKRRKYHQNMITVSTFYPAKIDKTTNETFPNHVLNSGIYFLLHQNLLHFIS